MNQNRPAVEHHPKGLPVMFLTEMWERFGYYIVQGLLIIYMTSSLGFSDSEGYTVLGAFTALAYVFPILGGFIADNILGFQRTIIIGNILLAVGYGLLATSSLTLFYIALTTIIVGVGFFKPNISSLLGTLYGDNDPRRESGFTIFYMGINLGVILATSLGGIIQKDFGWNASFVMASAGLIVGFFTFLAGRKNIQQRNAEVSLQNNDNAVIRFLRNKINLTIVTVIGAVISWLLLRHATMANLVLWISSVILVIALLYKSFQYQVETRNKFIALIILIALSIVFWALFFQMFFSLNLFIERGVDRVWNRHEIPTIMFIGLESVFIFVLGPFFAYLWHKLSQRGLNPSVAFKFFLGTLIVGLGFVSILLGIHFDDGNLVSPWWIVLAYLFVTMGELLLSPIGLSTVTVLAPANLVGMMMGVWFVALGMGGKLAGIIAQVASVPAGVTDLQSIEQIYFTAFSKYALLAFVVSALMLILVPVLRNLEKGRNPLFFKN